MDVVLTGLSAGQQTDILVPNWMIGKPAAFDVTVVSPCNLITLIEAGAIDVSQQLVKPRFGSTRTMIPSAGN